MPLSQDGATAGKFQIIPLIACSWWIHTWWEKLFELVLLDCKGVKEKIHWTIWFVDLVHGWHCGEQFVRVYFLTSQEEILLKKQTLCCVQQISYMSNSSGFSYRVYLFFSRKKTAECKHCLLLSEWRSRHVSRPLKWSQPRAEISKKTSISIYGN